MGVVLMQKLRNVLLLLLKVVLWDDIRGSVQGNLATIRNATTINVLLLLLTCRWELLSVKATHVIMCSSRSISNRGISIPRVVAWVSSNIVLLDYSSLSVRRLVIADTFQEVICQIMSFGRPDIAVAGIIFNNLIAISTSK
jgi:hypothetical protein